MGPRRGAVVLVLACCASGCATLGWRLVPNTRTYRYQREVVIDVQSSPSGAKVYEGDTLIGTAPFRHHTRHEVERKRRSRSGVGLALGCVVDSAIAGTLFYQWVDDGAHFSSTRDRVIFFGWLVPAVDCYMLALMVGVDYATSDSLHGTIPPSEPLWRRDRVSDKVIAKPLTLEARWLDWAPVKATTTVPDHSAIRFERGHAGTFDDALVRRARAGAPLSRDGVLRAARTYHRMATETRDPAHARIAIGYYEKYLADGDSHRRAEVEASIAELRRMEGTR